VNDLVQKLPDALVVVVGTQTEAHLVQYLQASFSHTPSLPDPRLVFAVLDPADPPRQGLLASRIIEGAAGMPNTKLVLLVAGRSAESLGVDAAFEATLVSRKLDLPAEAVNLDAPH